jgi:hypothetical protein
MKTIFLGGTCGNSKWRELLVSKLVDVGFPTERLFNPVVPDWTPECQVAEDTAKANAELNIFYLTSPEQDGNPISTYSNTEAIMALYDDPGRAVVVFDNTELTGHILKAQTKTEKDLRKRFPQGLILSSMSELVGFINAAR